MRLVGKAGFERGGLAVETCGLKVTLLFTGGAVVRFEDAEDVGKRGEDSEGAPEAMMAESDCETMMPSSSTLR